MSVNSATIVIANPSRDTGAIALPTITPALAIGTIGGGVLGFNMSRKHKVIGTLVGASLGGWLGQLLTQGNSAV